MPQEARTWAESPAPLPSLPGRATRPGRAVAGARASDSTGSSALMRRATARSSSGSLGATRYTTERRNIGMLSSRSVTSIGCPDHMRTRSASSALTARNRSSASGPIARANASPSSPTSAALLARSASTTACQTASDAPNAKVGLVWQSASPMATKPVIGGGWRTVFRSCPIGRTGVTGSAISSHGPIPGRRAATRWYPPGSRNDRNGLSHGGAMMHKQNVPLSPMNTANAR